MGFLYRIRALRIKVLVDRHLKFSLLLALASKRALWHSRLTHILTEDAKARTNAKQAAFGLYNRTDTAVDLTQPEQDHIIRHQSQQCHTQRSKLSNTPMGIH